MKKILTSILTLLATAPAFAQNTPTTVAQTDIDPVSSIIPPVLFMSFLVFMLVSLVKYFLEYRLKNKLIDKGTPENISAYLSTKNESEKQDNVIKWGILFCGIGVGLTVTYLTAPIHIHSLAIMAFSIGLSYMAYFCYLKRKNT